MFTTCIALPPQMYLSAMNDGHGSQFIPFREILSVVGANTSHRVTLFGHVERTFDGTYKWQLDPMDLYFDSWNERATSRGDDR